MVNFKNAHHYQNRLVLVASSGRGKQARHDDVICLLLSVFKMPTWHKMVLLISADSSGFPQPTPISTLMVSFIMSNMVSIMSSPVSVCQRLR